MNKGYGYQDIEKGKKNTANTMYLIGSSKIYYWINVKAIRIRT